MIAPFFDTQVNWASFSIPASALHFLELNVRSFIDYMRNFLRTLTILAVLLQLAFSGNAQCPAGALKGNTNVNVGATTTFTAPDMPTGGAETTSGGYRIHAFYTTIVTSTFTTPAGFTGTVERLMVGGGGAGGSNGGGGGGGGAFLHETNFTPAASTTYTVTIGLGGKPGQSGGRGGATSFVSGSYNASAQGGGGGGSRDAGGPGQSGGSGGGGGGASSANPSGDFQGFGTSGQGNNGGIGTAPDAGCNAAGGGGGGAGGAGGAASSTVAGNGGPGKVTTIGGYLAYFAGGGGGGRTCTNDTRGNASLGGGGYGGGNPITAADGGPNSGGGGGGGGSIGVGGSGGSGVSFIRYPDYTTGTWSSNNTSIATVNSSGVVTGVSPGTATIRLTSACGGVSTKVITVNSNNANLSGLTISPGTLSTTFAAGTTSYSGSIAYTDEYLTITPTQAELFANLQMRVNGDSYFTVTTGASRTIYLNPGHNTIDVKVTAPDGVATKIYTIVVTRANLLNQAGLPNAFASTAYSLRKLSSNYSGSAIQVRRSSDNTVQNIGFNAGGLDTAGLKSFVGSGNGFVTIWYDQSGHGRDLAQATAATQPQLVNAGKIRRTGNAPAVYFGTANLATTRQAIFHSAVTMVAVAKGTSTTPASFISKTGTAAGANTHYPSPFDFTNNGGEFYTGNAASGSGSTVNLANANPRSDISSLVPASVYSFTTKSPGGSTAYSYRNGVQTGAYTVAAYSDEGNFLRLGSRNDLSQQGNFYTPEMVMFNTVLSTSDRNALETNQKNAFLSAEAGLSALSISNSTMAPVFASGTTAYTALTGSSTTSVTVTPAAVNYYATIQARVNGGAYTTVASGSASAALPVSVGNNTIEIKVTGQDGSTIKTYTITLKVDKYCATGSSLDVDAHVTNVTFGGINNTSGATAGGYADYTALTGQIAAGTTAAFAATGSLSTYFRVWIDYNQDGDFTDAGELIYTFNGGGPYSGSIAVPLTATLGLTRMRVHQGLNTAPCGSTTNGETEDYTINITQQPVPVCAAGFSPASGAVNACAEVLSWQSALYATGYKVYLGQTATSLALVSTQTATTYATSGLTTGQTYYWKVVPYNGTGDAVGCGVNEFSNGVCYCPAGSRFVHNDLYINNINFAGISNASGTAGGGYQNFTAIIGQAAAGTTQTFTATGVGYDFSDSELRVWIDYNRDGDFTDAGELLYSANRRNGAFTTSIAIPPGVSPGVARMRVRIYYLNGVMYNSTTCGDSEYGQVEDYSINILPPPAAPVCTAGLLPVNSTVNTCAETLSWEPVTYAAGYKVYLGQSAAALTLVSTQTALTYTPSGLTFGQTYYWKVVPYNIVGDAANCTVNSFAKGHCYCAATSLNTDGQFISNVTFGGINNSTGTTGTGYQDFKAISGTVTAGSATSFSATGTGHGHSKMLVWIDYNRNGVFTDAGELVYTSVNGAGPYAASITIPATASAGFTTMRVRLDHITNAYNGTSCGESNVGQVEDYTIHVQVPAPGCASGFSPANGVSNFCENTLSWQAATYATGYKVYVGQSAGALVLVSTQAGTSYAATGLNNNQAYYWKVVPYNSTGEAASCTVNSFTRALCYCVAGSDNHSIDYIKSVDFAGISNNPGTPGSGYQDYTALTGQVTAGDSYVFSATIQGYYNSRVMAWIDYNRDGDFTDAGEQVYFAANGTGPYAASIAIPVTATAGLTRMRIRLDDTSGYNGTSCGNSMNGEVEDYSITILPPPVPACAAGFFPADGFPNACAEVVSWQTVPYATGYKVYMGSSAASLALVSTQSSTSYAPTGLTNGQVYYWKVVPYNSTGDATTCSVNSFTKGICYCPAGSTSTFVDYIKAVDFAGISNNPGTPGSGYQNYTNLVGQVSAGASYPFSATVSGAANSRLLVWIDYNRDGDFTDAGEEVYVSAIGAGPYAASIAIPVTASAGYTRMRVRLDFTTSGYNGTPCGNSTYGEVEDFSINIITVPGCVTGISPASGVESCLTSLNWQPAANATGYKVYFGISDTALNLVSDQTGTSYPLSGLESGGKAYFWNVVPYNASGENSSCPVNAFSTPTVTTWTGALSTDWFNSGNWTYCPPDTAVYGVIPDGLTVYPVITSGKATVKNLDIIGEMGITGGELEVSGNFLIINNATFTMAGQSVLTLKKQFALPGGTFTANGGTVAFTNPDSYTVPALTYPNLILNGGPNAVITTGGNIRANGNLTLSGAGATFQNAYTMSVQGDLEASMVQTGSGSINLITGSNKKHSVSGSAPINILFLTDPLGATMTENLTITGALNVVTGNFTAATGKTLTLNGTISERLTHKYEGELVKTVSVDPGMANNFFGNIGVRFNNADSGNWGEVTVIRHNGAGSFISNPTAPDVQGINRYWSIEPEFTPAGKTINLTLSWLSDENNGLTFPNNQAQVWKSEDNGLTWVPVGELNPVVYNGNQRSVTVQTGKFSLWTVSDALNPLPVTWLYFNGKATAEGNQLNWATATEKDSKAFVVERSVDGRSFEAIGEVKAAGNSSVVLRYEFLDKNNTVLTQKVFYYRLKQLDENGSFAYSSVVAISRDKGNAEIVVSPNPFSSIIQVTLPVTETASFKLTTSEGKTLYLKDKNALSGRVQLNDLPGLAPGIYLLQVVSDQTFSTLKVVKQ